MDRLVTGSCHNTAHPNGLWQMSLPATGDSTSIQADVDRTKADLQALHNAELEGCTNALAFGERSYIETVIIRREKE